MSEVHEVRSAFSVPFEYRVIFCDDVFGSSNPLLADLMGEGPSRAVVFVDQGVVEANPELVPAIVDYFQLHRQKISLAAKPVVLGGGEDAKRDFDCLKMCLDVLYDAHLDRHSFAIAIGGGAVLDAVGLAATLVHRGVRQIRIPTTVLAQNDAGIGVKNGIDYRHTKNFLGTFCPPHAVVNDFNFLQTLPLAGWRDGIAEAVKVGLIRDKDFFVWLEANANALAARDAGAMRYLVRRCAELHLAHIASGGDPFERGSARPLDFGHWAAHKLEQLSGFSISHGQAVAAGIVIDAAYSFATGLLAAEECSRIADCLRRAGFELALGERAGLRREEDLPKLLQGIADFQEHLGGELSLTMLRAAGSPIEIHTVHMEIMTRCCGQVLLGKHRSGFSAKHKFVISS